MDEDLHHIRFRRGEVEFELSGSSSQVNTVWSALAKSVTDALQSPSSQSASDAKKGSPKYEGTPPAQKKTPARKRSTPPGAGKTDRNAIQTALADAKLDEFPELGTSPTALYVGSAVLRFARDALGQDGLTISEVRDFAANRLRVPNTSPAYRSAFKRERRALDKSGSPAVYRLMKPGDAALDAYLATVAAGGGTAEAEAAASEAEQEAEAAEES